VERVPAGTRRGRPDTKGCLLPGMGPLPVWVAPKAAPSFIGDPSILEIPQSLPARSLGRREERPDGWVAAFPSEDSLYNPKTTIPV